MAIIMAVAAFVALRGLRRGVQEDTTAAGTGLSDQLPDEDPGADLDPAWRLGSQVLMDQLDDLLPSGHGTPGQQPT